MHKKALSLLLASVAASLLFGEVWESNALSMRLRLLPSVPESGYYLEVEDGKESLFSDGNLVRTKVFDDTGFVISEDGKDTRYILDDDERPVRIESEEGNVTNIYSEEGLLLSSTYSTAEGLEKVSEYHWSPEGKLMYVEDVDVSYYLPSSTFFYTRDDESYSINTDTPETFLEKLGEEKTKVEKLEEGVKMISGDGSERIYSDDGHLVHEIRNGITYDHTYEDGVLVLSVETDGRNVTRKIYEDGSLSETDFLVDGILTRKHFFNPDGTLIEERYRNGKAYARVNYDRDHRTIRSIDSL